MIVSLFIAVQIMKGATSIWSPLVVGFTFAPLAGIGGSFLQYSHTSYIRIPFIFFLDLISSTLSLIRSKDKYDRSI